MKHFKTVNKKNLLSFSLIEVLIFITLLSIFFIAGLSVALYSLNLLKIAEHKTLASYYGQEAIEWIKKEKETNWDEFKTKTSTSGKTYCLNELGWYEGSCLNFNLKNFYKREVELISNNNSININLTVSWQEKNGINNINIKTILNLWE